MARLAARRPSRALEANRSVPRPRVRADGEARNATVRSNLAGVNYPVFAPSSKIDQVVSGFSKLLV